MREARPPTVSSSPTLHDDSNSSPRVKAPRFVQAACLVCDLRVGSTSAGLSQRAAATHLGNIDAPLAMFDGVDEPHCALVGCDRSGAVVPVVLPAAWLILLNWTGFRAASGYRQRHVCRTDANAVVGDLDPQYVRELLDTSLARAIGRHAGYSGIGRRRSRAMLAPIPRAAPVPASLLFHEARLILPTQSG
jgi:hypothetical protein